MSTLKVQIDILRSFPDREHILRVDVIVKQQIYTENIYSYFTTVVSYLKLRYKTKRGVYFTL